jgi:hypothetical protein
MSTEAQICANQANAQHSTGPKTAETKAVSSMNNFRHGLAGAFRVLASENQDDFDQLLADLSAEHQPSTVTESMLIEKMAEHYWLGQRALRCQHACFTDDTLSMQDQALRLALFLRYQITHDRAFRAALTDLLKLKAEKRKQEIGFESHRRQNAIVALRESAENRRQERHKWDVLLAEAKVDHQIILNSNLEWDRKIATATRNDDLHARKAA